jgi:DNA-binding MarR family transcriptional regulator
MRDYPRIYFACHRRHTHDPDTGALLSAAQVSILDHLDAVEPTVLGDLAAHMGVTPGTMSIAVGRLVAQGYVARTLDAADRRRVQLRLTDAGARAQRRVGLRHGRHVAQTMTRSLTDEQLVQLHDLCRALAVTEPATTEST